MKGEKIIKTILFVLVLIFSVKLCAQTITEKLGIVKTDFDFFYEDKKLTIFKQGIIKRAQYHYRFENGQMGLEAYHLEFVYELEYDKNFEIENHKDYIAEFYSEEDELLTIIEYGLWKKASDNDESKTGKKYYAINLIDLPLFILDDTRKIIIRED